MKSLWFQRSGVKRFFVFLLTYSLCLLQTPLPAARAVVSEEGSLPAADSEYAPGDLIIKLKEGHTLPELDGLRQEHRILSAEQVFPKVPSAEESLEKLKKERQALENPDHSGWYWWSDKESKEYKKYAERVAKEKERLDRAIQGQEELVAHLAARRRRAPKGATAPSLDGIYLLKAVQEADVPALVAVFQAHPAVAYAEPNYIGIAEATLSPNDPKYMDFSQWGPRKIKADLAWKTTTGSGSVIIAIIDSGVDYNHPDLKDNMWKDPLTGEYGHDYVNNDNDPMDDYGHGTHCAGIANAVTDNGIGIAGVSWKSKIMAVKWLADDNTGFNSNAIQAIRWAVDHGADILSNSWRSDYSQLVKDEIDNAYSEGCVIVSLAGNGGSNRVVYPASYEHVISVAATDQDDKRALFSFSPSSPGSNYGPWIDVAAPGKSILSTVPTLGALGASSGYRRLEGTSMACPHVSGLAALILSVHPEYKHDQITWLLKETVQRLPLLENSFFPGFGLIDAAAAVGYVSATPPPRLIAEISRVSVNWVSVDWGSSTVRLEGTASGQDFLRATLWYSVDGKPWTEFPSGPNFLYRQLSQPVERGLLFSWRLRDIPTDDLKGILFLRLVVTATAAGGGKEAKAYSGPPDFSLVSPGNLLANPSSSTQINLTWADNANNETGYKVYRKTTVRIGGFDYTAQPSPSYYPAHYYTFTEMAPTYPDTYPYNTVLYPYTSSYTYPYTYPPYPLSYLAAGNVYPSYIGLSGPVGRSTASYQVMYNQALNKYTFRLAPYTLLDDSYVFKPANPTNGEFNAIATLGPNSTSYSNTALLPDTLYSYKVLAYNEGRESAASNVSAARTLKISPTAPSGLAAVRVSPTQINLTWSDNSRNSETSNNEEGFNIYRRRSDANFPVIPQATVGSGVTTYTSSGLYSNSTYYYKVSAYNNGGESSASVTPTAK